MASGRSGSINVSEFGDALKRRVDSTLKTQIKAHSRG
jgi:hypothetical protein